MSLKSKLESGKFAITCEVGPLKGTDITEVEEAAALLKDKVDAANVTDQQSSVMRLGSLATSGILINKGLEPIYQMTCRDRNRIALQSDLLSAWVMGIRNVLALTGDLPALGDHPAAKPVYDLDSVTLLHAIGRLNAGFDIAGNELKGKPAFFAGAVVKVDSDTEASMELQIAKLERKVAAGAKFIQTQAVYSADSFGKFMKRVAKLKVPVLAGVIPLKSAGMARFMNKNVSGVLVPEELIEKMADAEDKTATGIQICADLIKKLKPLCQGVHIMAIGWEKKVPSIIQAAGL
ncbi:MAG TPA: methylenetetrahydrofolate reductase [Dehalococcoidales bacterium]|nr:MAG: 5,10-methylenetetrahydrofolate reductase [Chloroflexi bacterium RBG_16_60_22]HJX12931.1 methylenetetrahydrofolate reductase [Dehalococcoidales bacterium]